jgi:stage V sporulation protein S
MKQKSVVGNNGKTDDISKTVNIASTYRITAIAGVIARMMHDKGSAKFHAVGADAVNHAVNALAIARSYLKDGGGDFTCTIEFIDPEIDNQENTAIRFSLDACPLRDYLFD